jgi:hypothetical protein
MKEMEMVVLFDKSGIFLDLFIGMIRDNIFIPLKIGDYDIEVVNNCIWSNNINAIMQFVNKYRDEQDDEVENIQLPPELIKETENNVSVVDVEMWYIK